MENFSGYAPEASDDDDDDDTSAESVRDKKDGQEQAKPSIFERSYDKKTPEKSASKTPETAEQHDQNIPLDKLDDSEKKLVADEYIQARHEEVRDELTDTAAASPEEAEVLANAALLEAIKDKLDQGEALTNQILNKAVAETVQQLGIELPETPEEDAPELAATALEQVDETSAEQAPSDDESTIPVQPAAVTPSPTPPARQPAAPVNAAAPPQVTTGGGNAVPPNAPLVSPFRHGPGGNWPPFIPYAGPGPNALPPTPNTSPNRLPIVIERRSAALPYLVVGYLLGRRRGRIKTERKLLPIQHKLEQEVTDLQTSIAVREEKIRTLVREQVTAKPAMAERIVEHIERRQGPKAAAEKLIDKHQPPEKLGRLAVTYERSENLSVREVSPSLGTPEVIKVPERPKSVETMTIPELLLLAAHIPIEQSTIKKLFETHRLDEAGLRRVARAYLRGEHYEKVLRDNQLAPERLMENSNPETLSAGSNPRSSQTDDGSSIRLVQTTPSLPRANSALHQTASDTPDVPRVEVSSPKARASKAVSIAVVLVIAVAVVLFLLR